MKRINIWGGPGCSKSTIAAKIYHEMKVAGQKVEVVRERIKSFAYMGRHPTFSERLRFFYEELEEETFCWEQNISVVSDSPLFLACYYYQKQGHPFAQQLIDISHKFEELCPSENWFVVRPTNLVYDAVGRFENAEEAKKVDAELLDFVKGLNLKHLEFYKG